MSGPAYIAELANMHAATIRCQVCQPSRIRSLALPHLQRPNWVQLAKFCTDLRWPNTQWCVGSICCNSLLSSTSSLGAASRSICCGRPLALNQFKISNVADVCNSLQRLQVIRLQVIRLQHAKTTEQSLGGVSRRLSQLNLNLRT
jgi:hypothetical protein